MGDMHAKAEAQRSVATICCNDRIHVFYVRWPLMVGLRCARAKALNRTAPKHTLRNSTRQMSWNQSRQPQRRPRARTMAGVGYCALV